MVCALELPEEDVSNPCNAVSFNECLISMCLNDQKISNVVHMQRRNACSKYSTKNCRVLIVPELP